MRLYYDIFIKFFIQKVVEIFFKKMIGKMYQNVSIL